MPGIFHNLRLWFTAIVETVPEEEPVQPDPLPEPSKEKLTTPEPAEEKPVEPVPPQSPQLPLFSGSSGLALNLSAGLSQVQQLAVSRLKAYFGTGNFEMPLPELYDDGSPLFNALHDWALTADEYLALMIALAPELQPDFYDALVQQYLYKDGDFSVFGGIRGSGFRGMVPTGDTVLFLLNGSDLSGRLATRQRILSAESRLIKDQVLVLEEPKDGEPETSGRLKVGRDFLEMFLFGREWNPRFSTEFPAQQISTKMDWSDFVVSRQTLLELEVIQSWLAHEPKLWTDVVLKKRIKRGYRALFYGSPGTGKTLAAALLGKRFGKAVYRVDLSQMVSKYIGETSKIAAKLFDLAENKNWILFFDEADALFGKRTSVTTSNDRYANQDVSYLLQRVEDYNGLVILASNFKNNIDNAFMRRFQSVINFGIPDQEERLRLWMQTKPEIVKLGEDVDLNVIARKYELSGASILNVYQIATIRAIEAGGVITRSIILDEIGKEFSKESKTL